MNSFGRLFRVELFGESHGPSVGVIIDGCPSGVPFSASDMLPALARRRGGRPGTTARVESDEPLIESGVFEGRTTGTPVLIRFLNRDQRPDDYAAVRHSPRPGHADLTRHHKFGGHHDPRGGGHASGRLTVGLVAAGALAAKLLTPVVIKTKIVQLGGVPTPETASGESDVPSEAQREVIAAAAAAEDSVGGVVQCVVEGLPAGIGEPFFDSLESCLAHAIFAIPGIKALEFGAGWSAACLRGSAHNDPISPATATGRPLTTADVAAHGTNHAGGALGGISTGSPVVFRVAVRPPAGIGRAQQSVDLCTGRPAEIRVGGRHDTCIALRVPPILEALTAIVLYDLIRVHEGLNTVEAPVRSGGLSPRGRPRRPR